MLGSGIFSIFGAGLNEAISSGAADEQWGNQLKLMDIQNRYNEQMAKNNQELAIVTGKQIGRAHV